jgi:N-acetylglucosaminyldiphosphoundecaprenol N-acetyl-beta-D-mannosaminyltransferase
MNNRFAIDKIRICKINIKNTLQIIDDSILAHNYGYICVTNSRTAYLANNDELYCKVQNNSFLTVPDGMPIVWIAHNIGYNEVGKVSGKELMDSIFLISEQKRYSHYFFGSTPETIKKLKNNLIKKYGNISIKGAVSPPFQPIENFDIEKIAHEINQLNPTFFWCGLGAPKQEQLIALLQPKLQNTFCIGVGLAFEYIAGTVKRAPLFMQKIGLEWAYRLLQQPRNIPRAFFPFLWIIKKLIISYVKK